MNKYAWWEIGLIKWSVFFFTLFLISAFPAFTLWVSSIHWSWFLILAFILGIYPAITFFKK